MTCDKAFYWSVSVGWFLLYFWLLLCCALFFRVVLCCVALCCVVLCLVTDGWLSLSSLSASSLLLFIYLRICLFVNWLELYILRIILFFFCYDWLSSFSISHQLTGSYRLKISTFVSDYSLIFKLLNLLIYVSISLFIR